MDDLLDTDDEEAYLAHFLNKHNQNAKQIEDIRDRQQKMADLNDLLRKYDLDNIKDDEMEKLREEMMKLNLNWGSLQTSIDEKMKFALGIHLKHTEEVRLYNEYADNLDKDKFAAKIKRAHFELKTDGEKYQ